MRKLLSSIAVVGLGVGLMAPQAGAVPEPSGFDAIPQVAVGGGSDTTYLVMQRLEALYNSTPGCTIITSSSNANKGKCDTTKADINTAGNFDHDVMVSATPTGSSAGVVALAGGAGYNPAIDYARSSRGPANGATPSEVGLTFWGFARDAQAVITFGTRTGVSLTKQQLKDIYLCNTTDWSQIPGAGAAGPIIPWDVNPSSGTFASFVSYLDNITFGACVKKLSSGVAAFENDVKPILSDSFITSDPSRINNSIWWMSFANWQTYPYTKNGTVGSTVVNSNLVTLEGKLPSDASINDPVNPYPALRTVNHVTRDADAINDASGPNVLGADGGVGGAVREFTEWLCRTANSQHVPNVVTGRGMRTEIVRAINAEGYQQVPVGSLRFPGYSCAVSTATS